MTSFVANDKNHWAKTGSTPTKDLKFKIMEECIKCNSKEISLKFIPKETKIYWSEHNEINNLSEFTRSGRYYSSDKTNKEFLIYKCKKCGYKTAIKTKIL